MIKLKAFICILFPIFIHLHCTMSAKLVLEPSEIRIGIVEGMILGGLIGLFIVLMKQLPKKIRRIIAFYLIILTIGLLIYYVAYDFLPMEFKKMTSPMYKLCMKSRYELFFLGGICITMLGKWENPRGKLNHTMRLIILFTSPILMYGIEFFNLVSTIYMHYLYFVLWGFVVGMYAWMSFYLPQKSLCQLLIVHGALFGIILTIINLSMNLESNFLNTWGFISLFLYFFSQKQKNSYLIHK